MADIIVIVCLALLFCTFIIYAWNEIKEIVISRNAMKRIADIPKDKDLINGKYDKNR